MITTSPVPGQVKLPARVAVGVVWQGIRIRLDRSIVTLLGVALGIAFLTAALGGVALRRSVSAEDKLRAEVERLRQLVRIEVGPATQHTYAIIVAGPLAEVERRLLREWQQTGLARLTVIGDATALAGVLTRLRPEPLPPVAATTDATLAVVLGDGPVPELPWVTILAGMRSAVVAFTRQTDPPPALATANVLQLAHPPRAAELAKAAAAQRQERFRGIWITTIALLVTVIGIANAMLMSVTERFREIGTMKCLGALSGFIRTMFLIESALLGLVGGILGSVGGTVVTLVAYGFTYGFGMTAAAARASAGPLVVAAGGAVVTGLVLAVVAALYPARVAARMVPADALRTNI